MLDELEALGRDVRRVAADLAQVREDLVVRPPVGVAQERRVAPDRAERVARASSRATERSAASRAAAGSVAIGSPARSKSSTSRSTRSSAGDGEPDAEVGQALADEALGRVDQEDRRLEPAGAIDEVGLLPGVLEVVARIRLVGDQSGRGRAPGPAGRC